jgi:hypothetical protein
MIEFPSVPETAVFHCGGKNARERMSITELRRRNELSGDRRQPGFQRGHAGLQKLFRRKDSRSKSLESHPFGRRDTTLHDSGSVPQDGLVAEYLLTHDIAQDTANSHDEIVSGATWIVQDGQ